jgi:hypothetical protein
MASDTHVMVVLSRIEAPAMALFQFGSTVEI